MKKKTIENTLKTFYSYRRMKDRCLNNKHAGFHNYGVRGITICERWLGRGGYHRFLEDMGERPAGKSLDRINPHGNYEPTNCRWATRSQQSANTKNRKPSKAGYRGIYFKNGSKHPKRPWVARIARDNQVTTLGSFPSAEEAARAYDCAALLAYGDFAQINFDESRNAF